MQRPATGSELLMLGGDDGPDAVAARCADIDRPVECDRDPDTRAGGRSAGSGALPGDAEERTLQPVEHGAPSLRSGTLPGA
jgi:hypothetical protein